MYLHALAIQQVYSNEDLKKAWNPLLKKIVVTKLSEYDSTSNAYHRTLALALELFEIDNSQLFKKYTGQEELPDILKAFQSAKKKINFQAILDAKDSTISRANKYFVVLFEELGFLNYNGSGMSLLEIEKPVAGGLLTLDFYLGGDYDMIIDVHGPIHFQNQTLLPIDSMLYIDRIITKYHKNYLVIPYHFYNEIMLRQGEYEVIENSLKLKKLIED
jgi:hypothetical protein